MVSGLRTNLDAEIIAICQVLRSWYRAGLIKDLNPLLKSHLESKLDAGCVTLSEDELALAESKWLLEGENSASEVDDSSQQQQIEELVSTSESGIREHSTSQSFGLSAIVLMAEVEDVAEIGTPIILSALNRSRRAICRLNSVFRDHVWRSSVASDANLSGNFRETAPNRTEWDEGYPTYWL
ncbi:hypothetical protein HZ326_14172 [Fusarium oxysporum f. sp. albedinis]|nr:hypothetical protein HZ326_14172 [Fusarium oxysporum f. sp. albedinis]